MLNDFLLASLFNNLMSNVEQRDMRSPLHKFP